MKLFVYKCKAYLQNAKLGAGVGRAHNATGFANASVDNFFL